MKNCFMVIVLAFIIVCSNGLSASDTYWPGWLGPDRTGWVANVESPHRWPNTLQTAWSVQVGTGYGSPLVVDGLVFQHARQQEEEVLWCIDLASGETKWRKAVSVPFKVRGGGEFHGKGPKSCPVYSEGRVFTLTISGDLIAWSAASGEILWRTQYGKKYSQNHPHWGTSTSPVVDGTRVFMHFGNDDAGELVALDVETGKEVWSQGKAGASYSSPLLVEIEGVRQVVEWDHQSLVGVDSHTGDLLWSYPFPHEGSNQNMPTPTFFKGMVVLGAENRGIHGFQPRMEDGKWSVEKKWSQTDVALDMSTAVINADFLYGMSHYGKGRIFCLEPKTGDIKWRSEGRFGQNATFLSMPGHVVGLNDRGKLRVINATDAGYQVAQSWTVSDKPTWAPPVLMSDGFLVKDENTLLRLKF